jgi:hypothetical protein
MKDPKRVERYQRWKQVDPAILNDLLKMTGQESYSLVQNSVDGKIDPYYTVFREGKRSIWLDIMSCLMEPPDIPEGDYEGESS